MPNTHVNAVVEENQSKKLEKAFEACVAQYGANLKNLNDKLQSSYNETLKTWFCPPLWDTVLCWPPTPENSTVTLKCSDNVIGFLENENASRTCTEGGKWFTLSNGQAWANYTNCENGEDIKIYQTINITAEISDTDELLIKTAKMLATIGYSVSFVSLVIAFLIMFSIKKLHCPRNILHMNLFVSFMLRALLTLIKDIVFVDGMATKNDIVYENGSKYYSTGLDQTNFECKLISSMLQYCVTANYFWLLMEGIYLNNLIFRALFADSSRNLTYYIISGWGLPAVFVILWVIGRIYGDDTLCWTLIGNIYVYMIVAIPISASIIINFVLFVIISVVLYTKLRSPINEDSRRYLKWAKSTLVLIPLFGVYYFQGLIFKHINETYYFWLISDTAFGSFQGFLVAVLYCFLNGEVKAELKPRIHSVLIFLATNEFFRYCFPCRQRYLRSAVGRQSVCTTTMSCSSLYANNILHRNSRSSKWDLFSKPRSSNPNDKLPNKDHSCMQKHYQSANNGYLLKDSSVHVPTIVESSLCIEKNVVDSSTIEEEISMLPTTR